MTRLSPCSSHFVKEYARKLLWFLLSLLIPSVSNSFAYFSSSSLALGKILTPWESTQALPLKKQGEKFTHRGHYTVHPTHKHGQEPALLWSLDTLGLVSLQCMQSSPVGLCSERGCHTHRWIKALWQGLSYRRMHQFNFWEAKSVTDSWICKETQNASLNHDILSESSRREVQAEVFPRNKMLKFEMFVSGVQAGFLPPPLPFRNGVASTENFASGDFLQELISIPPHRCLLFIFSFLWT